MTDKIAERQPDPYRPSPDWRMSAAEITAAHRDNVMKQVACMVADLLQDRNQVQACWEEAVKVRHVPADNPFRERMAYLSGHMDRFIAEATQAASCEWREPERFCYVEPVTEEFARHFRAKIMDEAERVIEMRKEARSRRPQGAKRKAD